MTPARIVAIAIAIAVACLSLLPLATWMPGGRETVGFAEAVDRWMFGALFVIGGAVALTILSRHTSALWRDGLLDAPADLFVSNPWRSTTLLALIALGVYAMAAGIYDRRPLLIDELVQLFQARIFLGGRLFLPASDHPEFFSALNTVDLGGRVYAQFPAGGPAMQALGLAVGAAWLVGPVFGALTVALFVTYLRRAEERPGTVMGAALLLAFAPFTVFMAASHMNHVTSLFWIVLGMASLAHVVTSTDVRAGLAFLMGLGFGAAATIRPVDALAFALPAGAWLLVRAARDRRRLPELAASGLGVAIPMAALMWVNLRTTGHPLVFGYEVLWGKSQALGFHASPWGMAHTPARGLELVSLYFFRLGTFLFESPIPSLVPAIVALALTRRFDALDRYLLASSALLIGLYFAYWHDGFFPGPRFMYPLLPALALWTARSLPRLGERFGRRGLYRGAVYASAITVAMALGLGLPARAREYAQVVPPMRWDVDSAAAAAGVRHSVVLVRESWGAQLIARMWALGVPRSETDLLFRRVDPCALELRVGALERSTLRDSAAWLALRPSLSDPAQAIVPRDAIGATAVARVAPRYAPRCLERVADDRAGVTFYPLVMAHADDNVYARDLHARDTLLLARWADRPLYLLAPASDSAQFPRFVPLSRDSLIRAWSGQR